MDGVRITRCDKEPTAGNDRLRDRRIELQAPRTLQFGRNVDRVGTGSKRVVPIGGPLRRLNISRDRLTVVLAARQAAFHRFFRRKLSGRRQGIGASKWLMLWIVGLGASLAPMAILFMALEALKIPTNLPTEIFVNGFIVAGIAAFVSGRTLFDALSGRPARFIHKQRHNTFSWSGVRVPALRGSQ